MIRERGTTHQKVCDRLVPRVLPFLYGPRRDDRVERRAHTTMASSFLSLSLSPEREQHEQEKEEKTNQEVGSVVASALDQRQRQRRSRSCIAAVA